MVKHHQHFSHGINTVAQCQRLTFVTMRSSSRASWIIWSISSTCCLSNCWAVKYKDVSLYPETCYRKESKKHVLPCQTSHVPSPSDTADYDGQGLMISAAGLGRKRHTLLTGETKLLCRGENSVTKALTLSIMSKENQEGGKNAWTLNKTALFRSENKQQKFTEGKHSYHVAPQLD